MVIFTHEAYTRFFQNQIRNYSVADEFGYSEYDIKASKDFFARPNVDVGSHGWNHSENLNHANLSYAYQLINHTFWNLKNNYGITSHFYLGHNTDGNYNITLALRRFSQTYWNVYGEDFRWYSPWLFPNGSRDDPAVEYIGKATHVAMFDPLFGCSWSTPCKTLSEAKHLFNVSSAGKEILFIRGHPEFLNDDTQKATQNLTKWQQWIDWIYQTHRLININHTQAVQYNVDRYNFNVEYDNQQDYIIDLSRCMFDHDVLFTNPDTTNTQAWALHDQTGTIVGVVNEDVFIPLKKGMTYILSRAPESHPPTADFSWSPFYPSEKQQVTFTDRSIAGSASITTWSWEFGDGTTSSRRNPTHVYTEPGSYPVHLTIADTAQRSDSIEQIIHVIHSQDSMQDTTSPGPPILEQNKHPLAIISPGKPYGGFVNSELVFDGLESYDPDGDIVSWLWDFGDMTNGTGKTVSHRYTKTGTYTITLTVTDDQGAPDTDATTCVITQPNRPPTPPTINGSTYGTKNSSYDYTVTSTDADADPIRYSIRWDDQPSYENTTTFVPSGTHYTCSHRWTTAGIYTITVRAYDNQTESSPTYYTVLIDVRYIGDLGYLINQDADSEYDAFYCNSTMNETRVQKQVKGLYLIDSDGDNEWDHCYNPATSNIIPYSKTPGFELVVLLCASIGAIVLRRKKHTT